MLDESWPQDHLTWEEKAVEGDYRRQILLELIGDAVSHRALRSVHLRKN